MGHQLRQPQNTNILLIHQIDHQNEENQLDWHGLEGDWKIPKVVPTSLWR